MVPSYLAYPGQTCRAYRSSVSARKSPTAAPADQLATGQRRPLRLPAGRPAQPAAAGQTQRGRPLDLALPHGYPRANNNVQRTDHQPAILIILLTPRSSGPTKTTSGLTSRNRLSGQAGRRSWIPTVRRATVYRRQPRAGWSSRPTPGGPAGLAGKRADDLNSAGTVIHVPHSGKKETPDRVTLRSSQGWRAEVRQLETVFERGFTRGSWDTGPAKCTTE